MDVVVGAVPHPGVIGGGVVRDEVEHQQDSVPVQAVAEPDERLRLPEFGVEPVAGDGKGGTADVLLPEVGEQAPVLCEPPVVRAGDPAPRLPGFPDPHEVNPGKTAPCKSRDPGVREIVERDTAPRLPGEVPEPDAGVDLVEGGVTGGVHGCGVLDVWMDNGIRRTAPWGVALRGSRNSHLAVLELRLPLAGHASLLENASRFLELPPLRGGRFHHTAE